MKLVLYRAPATESLAPGLLTDRGVVDIAHLVRTGYTPQITMQNLIDDFETLRPSLERAVRRMRHGK